MSLTLTARQSVVKELSKNIVKQRKINHIRYIGTHKKSSIKNPPFFRGGIERFPDRKIERLFSSFQTINN